MNVASPAPRLGQLPKFLRICVRHVHGGKKPSQAKPWNGPENHGENIWVFGHRRTEQIIYSLQEKLDGFHDLKQLPFNGKKTKPAKLRKDYWSPFATISFPAGHGTVGRSVFQKLRELKHLHEVAWDDDVRRKRPEEFNEADKKKIAEEEAKGFTYHPIRSKKERGVALNAQKQNAVADMAAVLSGAGRGNKVVVDGGEGAEGAEKKLLGVTVSWANDHDREYAQEWTSNVQHKLFATPTYASKGEVQAQEAAGEAKVEAAQPSS